MAVDNLDYEVVPPALQWDREAMMRSLIKGEGRQQVPDKVIQKIQQQEVQDKWKQARGSREPSEMYTVLRAAIHDVSYACYEKKGNIDDPEVNEMAPQAEDNDAPTHHYPGLQG